MNARCHLKNALAKKEAGIGMWLTLPGTALARTIATIPGFNWFLVDAEHGQITDKDYYELNNAITSHGISPIIRIPSSDDSWLIKRALDSGAHGLMIPMVHNATIAKRIVSQSKFAPQGTRGCGSPFTHHIFGVSENEYEVTCNDNLLVVLQIESQDGHDNVEEIAAVDGVDVLFVGPFDLAKSMDIKFGSDEHEAAIARILKATKAAGKVASIFCMSGEQGRKRLAQGFDMVSIAMDTDSLIFEFTRQLEAVKA
ncbi:Pyruvate/Phosphoenolpyruvate kinase-like domain-containing protein [Leucosporidium creatinivorum]|uniref:Pyruvate/Phosphoenolpyruvate kinase-like domain-containing protein n=1 Tax=Leucosporidium creatinivorum TaxID=106004 RepID=A0A1Y2CC90_9BASI|nr:Pyruvate/Phosphoenolpyruvate kinase-like domain-containing protein [Leucosporidium creatinivorum]